MVGVMRRIEFIGSALDQAGLRSSIKKGSECFGIGRTPAGLFARGERRSCCTPRNLRLRFSADHRRYRSEDGRLNASKVEFDSVVRRFRSG